MSDTAFELKTGTIDITASVKLDRSDDEIWFRPSCAGDDCEVYLGTYDPTPFSCVYYD